MLTNTVNIFFSLIIGGSTWSSIGGNFLFRPLSVSMVVVTKKKISNKNAISAIEPAFTSGAALFAMIYYLFKIFLAPEKIIDKIAKVARI